MRHKIERTIEERIDLACKNVLSRIPEHLHCEDLYQDIACIYFEIYSSHPDRSHAIICNQIYKYINNLINKYENNKYSYAILPEYNNIADEDDMMFMITDIFGIIRNFLTEREFGIICRRFIDNEGYEYIGRNVYHISGNRVKQIESKAIRKLRHPKCGNLIRDFCR